MKWASRLLESREKKRMLAALLSLQSALVGMTCAGAGRLEPPLVSPARPSEAPAPSQDRREAPAAAPKPETLALAGALAPLNRALLSDAHLLSHFLHQLNGLATEQRSAPVRVVWFGDSHTAADFLPNALRRALQERFTNGGPGFVRMGLAPYRHAQVKVERYGKWRREPRSPAGVTPQGDGIFGLGGIAAVPSSEAARATLEPALGDTALTFEILYRLPERAGFEISLGQKVVLVRPDTESQTADPSPIRRLKLSGTGSETLELSSPRGEPVLFGTIIETEKPGVVLDTVGIDGARVATLLAWDEAHWVAELRVRDPALLVFAFGTNELFDADAPEKYLDHYRTLMERMRKAAPEASCLLIGPTDAATEEGGSQARVGPIDEVHARAAEQSGCAYVSALVLMGGPGGFVRWARAAPPLARSDRVHLTVDGYERLGKLVANRVLSAYDEVFGAKSP